MDRVGSAGSNPLNPTVTLLNADTLETPKDQEKVKFVEGRLSEHRVNGALSHHRRLPCAAVRTSHR